MTIDAECEASWILRNAGFCDAVTILARELAEAMMGRGCIRVMRLMGRPAHYARVHDDERIYVRPGLLPEEKRFAVMHECAEKHLSDLGYSEPDRERVADAIAAALVAPRRAYLDARRDVGDDFSALAACFVATETCAALRLAETTGIPVAVVASSHVRAHQGDCGFVWPHGEELRRHARGAICGITRHPLSGRRVALVADAA